MFAVGHMQHASLTPLLYSMKLTNKNHCKFDGGDAFHPKKHCLRVSPKDCLRYQGRREQFPRPGQRASSYSMAIVVKPFSRSSVVVERKNFLIHFNLEKLLSPLDTLIRKVNNILKTIPRFGAKSRIFYRIISCLIVEIKSSSSNSMARQICQELKRPPVGVGW
ncbi:hypothetical protein TNCV_1327381 [Trichonephila clavipes]|nr:hypothetical protein TNCV_1327381 [Trichonephila clavipes]